MSFSLTFSHAIVNLSSTFYRTSCAQLKNRGRLRLRRYHDQPIVSGVAYQSLQAAKTLEKSGEELKTKSQDLRQKLSAVENEKILLERSLSETRSENAILVTKLAEAEERLEESEVVTT